MITSESGVPPGERPEGLADAGPEVEGPEAGACMIAESDYDQSCSVDLDCVASAGSFPVEFGDWCTSMCFCGGGVISRNAVLKFVTNVSRTPLGSGAIAPGNCSCPGFLGSPCCQAGKCARTGCSQPPNDGGVARDSGYASGPIADAGDAAAGDSAASRDSAPTDGGAVDAACGWTNDAGRHSGWCSQGGVCCMGGAVGTYYCYSGEGGCPAVP